MIAKTIWYWDVYNKQLLAVYHTAVFHLKLDLTVNVVIYLQIVFQYFRKHYFVTATSSLLCFVSGRIDEVSCFFIIKFFSLDIYRNRKLINCFLFSCRSMVKPYERLPCIVTSCSKKNPSRNNGGGITTGKGSSSGPIVINQQDKGIWTTRPWGMCSKICGVGRKVRYVRCRSSSNRLLSETLCDKATKPASSATCKIRDCKG